MTSGLDGALLLSATKLYAVLPPPVENQITELLNSARDKEAITLFMNACRSQTAGASLSTKLRKYEAEKEVAVAEVFSLRLLFCFGFGFGLIFSLQIL